jgi:secreted trypsin-like serine protease
MPPGLNCLLLFAAMGLCLLEVGVFAELQYDTDAAPILGYDDSGVHVVPRIIDGTASVKGQWPFMAAVGYRNGEVFCSATILSDRFVLSATHCFSGDGGDKRPASLEVTAGTADLLSPWAQRRDVKQMTLHKQFVNPLPAYPLQNDIAIIEVLAALGPTK